MNRADLLGFLAASDAYVSLHRAEGFGLPLAEAMLLGKPAVATNYSGNLDFMTPRNSWLVDFRRVALDRGHRPYPAGGTWAEPDLDHAAEQMRHVYRHREDANEVARRGRDELRALLSAAAAGGTHGGAAARDSSGLARGGRP